jgi:repressor LexA
MRMVTPVQQRVYEYIETHLQREGHSPSLSEIARGIGISPKSVSLISRCVHALTEAGRLTTAGKGYRRLQLVANNDVALPLVGYILPGTPAAMTESKPMLDLRFLLDPTHFLLQVKGDAMVNDGILDGDVIICKQAEFAKEGDSVLALIDGRETTLKRISYQIKNHITLVSANPQQKPKAYAPSRITVQGVYQGVLRRPGDAG